MADLVFLGVIVAFLGLAVLLVRGCERIIGADVQAMAPSGTTPAPTGEEVAA